MRLTIAFQGMHNLLRVIIWKVTDAKLFFKLLKNDCYTTFDMGRRCPAEQFVCLTVSLTDGFLCRSLNINIGTRLHGKNLCIKDFCLRLRLLKFCIWNTNATIRFVSITGRVWHPLQWTFNVEHRKYVFFANSNCFHVSLSCRKRWQSLSSNLWGKTEACGTA